MQPDQLIPVSLARLRELEQIEKRYCALALHRPRTVDPDDPADVPKIIEADRRLRESEQRYRLLYESNPDFIFTIDLEARLRSCNGAAALIGYSALELEGRPFLELVHPEERAASAERFQCAPTGEIPRRLVRVRYANGHFLHLDVSSAPYRVDGRAVGVTCIAKDITERMLARQRLQESEERYRRLFERSPDGIAVTLADASSILAVNPVGCEMLGYAEEQLISGGFGLFGMASERELQDFLSERARVGTVHSEWLLRRSDGQIIPVETSSALYSGADGQSYAVVMFRDVSERKRREQELTESREEIRELLGFLQLVREEEQKRIAREFHDELGQLLTVLQLDIGYIRRKLPAQERQIIKHLDGLGDRVNGVNEAMRRLLLGLRPQALDESGLGSASQQLVADFRKATAMQACLCVSHAEFQLDERLATAAYRIIQEALTNVSRYAAARRVRVSVLLEDEALLIQVVDDGRGFAIDAVKPKEHGYGITGMRERAQMVGGSLQVVSSPGHGTELIARLPTNIPGVGVRDL